MTPVLHGTHWGEQEGRTEQHEGLGGTGHVGRAWRARWPPLNRTSPQGSLRLGESPGAQAGPSEQRCAAPVEGQ